MAGYSSTPLITNLGIKAGFNLIVINEPPSYWTWISPVPEGVTIKSKSGARSLDFIHLFVSERKTYEREALRLKKALKANGIIWISWPKKSSGMVSDVDENVIWNFAFLKRTRRHHSLCYGWGLVGVETGIPGERSERASLKILNASHSHNLCIKSFSVRKRL